MATVKILDQKVEVRAQSKVGSLDNATHRPGGGDKKIFNDVEYLRQTSSGSAGSGSGSRRQSASQVRDLTEEQTCECFVCVY